MGKKRQLKKARQKQREVQEDLGEFLEEFDSKESDEIEEIEGDLETEEKDSDMMVGPTTWEELQELREAEIRAERVREVSWDFNMLLRNIMGNGFMGLKDKISAIKRAADGVESRVNNALSQKEIDELEAEVLHLHLLNKEASDDASLVDKGIEYLQRAKLTSEQRSELPDSAFALVVERDGKKVRKYPIHDDAHVRNALARAAQQIDAGGQGAADARKALPKIREAAKKMGIGMPSKKRLNAITVQKDSKGNWRWLGWVSNNFVDRENEIISEGAHKDYIEWLNNKATNTPNLRPEFRVWHIPGTARKNRADWWSYTNGFLLMSGILAESEAKSLMSGLLKHDIGMSHGFLVLERDAKDSRVITKYRTYEVSDLPLEAAANPWTSIEAIMSKEAIMAKFNKEEYAKEMIGNEFLDELFDTTEKKQTFLGSLDVESKEVEEPEEEVEKVEEVVEAAEEAKELDLSEDARMVALVKALADKLELKELSNWVDGVDGRFEKIEKDLATLRKDKDEELASLIDSGSESFSWSRKSEDNGNVLDEEDEKDKELLDSTPKNTFIKA